MPKYEELYIFDIKPNAKNSTRQTIKCNYVLKFPVVFKQMFPLIPGKP